MIRVLLLTPVLMLFLGQVEGMSYLQPNPGFMDLEIYMGEDASLGGKPDLPSGPMNTFLIIM